MKSYENKKKQILMVDILYALVGLHGELADYLSLQWKGFTLWCFAKQNNL